MLRSPASRASAAGLFVAALGAGCSSRPADCGKVCAANAACAAQVAAESHFESGDAPAPPPPSSAEAEARRRFCEDACNGSAGLRKSLGSCDQSDCFAQVMCVNDAMVEDPALNRVPQSCLLPAESQCEQYGLPAAIVAVRPTCGTRGGTWQMKGCPRDAVLARCVGEADSVVFYYTPAEGKKAWTLADARAACVMGKLVPAVP
ncbi:MAG: hypothetical protein IT373_33715 [Polyangiaceae bacterium]|nr:hypothetical protein [Polyangiaceae bacterium]